MVERLLDTIIRLTADDRERRGCLVINGIPEAVGIRVLGRAGQTRPQLQAVADGAKLLLRRHLRGRQP